MKVRALLIAYICLKFSHHLELILMQRCKIYVFVIAVFVRLFPTSQNVFAGFSASKPNPNQNCFSNANVIIYNFS